MGSEAGPTYWRFLGDSSANSGDLIAAGYGNRMGEYFPNFANRDGLPTKTFGERSGDRSDLARRVVFIGTTTGILSGYRAAEDAAIVSPLTELLVEGPDQEKLKRQLGVTAGNFRLLSTDPDLLTFDPLEEKDSSDADLAADAQRLLAAHLRALALLTLQSSDAASGNGAVDSTPLAEALAAGADDFLFDDNDKMTAIVAALPRYSGLRSDVQSAIAHVVNVYAATVPLRIERDDQIAQFEMAIRGYLRPLLIELVDTNTAEAAAEALAINTQTIRDATERFAEGVAITQTGLFFIGPDYYVTAPGTMIELIDVRAMSQRNGHPLENDWTADDDGFRILAENSVTSVSVPSANASEVSASLGEDSRITTMPASGFSGVTFIDYTATNGRGEERPGRIFVRVE
jgi:hypothetical protein